MSIAQTVRSWFGASKVAANVLIEEYGRYLGLRTACFGVGVLAVPSLRYPNPRLFSLFDEVCSHR
jgi:CDP-paratose 2-epimerase